MASWEARCLFHHPPLCCDLGGLLLGELQTGNYREEPSGNQNCLFQMSVNMEVASTVTTAKTGRGYRYRSSCCLSCAAANTGRLCPLLAQPSRCLSKCRNSSQWSLWDVEQGAGVLAHPPPTASSMAGIDFPKHLSCCCIEAVVISSQEGFSG
jgi:hypothetical protein